MPKDTWIQIGNEHTSRRSPVKKIKQQIIVTIISTAPSLRFIIISWSSLPFHPSIIFQHFFSFVTKKKKLASNLFLSIFPTYWISSLYTYLFSFLFTIFFILPYYSLLYRMICILFIKRTQNITQTNIFK